MDNDIDSAVLSDVAQAATRATPIQNAGSPEADVLNDMSSAVTRNRYEVTPGTYYNQPGVGLINRGAGNPDAAAQLAALKAGVNVIKSPASDVPYGAADNRTLWQHAQAEVGQGPGEFIRNSVLPIPGAIAGGIGRFASELGAPNELDQPWLQSIGGSIQRAGESITPGDWNKPTTLVGSIPSAFGKTFGAALDFSQKGWNELGELTGFPRIGAVIGSSVSASPALMGAKQAIETGVGAAREAIQGPTPEVAGPETPMPQIGMAGGGSAAVSVDPYPQLSNAVYPGQGAGFQLVKPSMSPGNAPIGDQAVRAQVARDIGITDYVRDSTATGNPQDLWDEVTEKNRSPTTPEGAFIRERMATEQGAVRTFGSNIVNSTGANPRVDPEGSGMLVADPLWQAKELVRQNASAMYTEAFNRVGQNPIQTSNLDATINDPAWQNSLLAKNKDTLNAVTNMYDLFRKQGMATDAGPSTIRSAEAFRQFITSIEDFSNTRVLSPLKEAVDSDVGAAGGADLLANARENWKTYKTNFADPKGISSLLSDPNDINRRVSYEGVTQNFLRMPNAQAAHVWTQLGNIKNIPGVTDELVQAATQAQAELKGAAVRSVVDAAGKTASLNGVAANTTLNALLPKLRIVLADDPEIMRQLGTFNLGTQLFPDTTAYRGAEIQKETVAHQVAVKGAPFVGGAIGGAAGSLVGPGAAATGATVGATLGTRFAGRMEKGFAASKAAETAARYSRNAQIGSKAP